MADDVLPQHLAALAPYGHDIEIKPGVFTNSQTTRIREIRDLLWPTLRQLCGGSLQGRRLLDVGCNCGGVSFLAAEDGVREVVGVDPHPRNIVQANAVRNELDASCTRFVQADIDRWLEDVDERFDVVLLLGVMYHLRDPIGTAQRLGALDASLWVVDAHVHYSSDPVREDMATWWMLPDNDAPARGGESELRPHLDRHEWQRFVAQRPVDYQAAPDQFAGAPHSQREREFVQLARGSAKHVDPGQEQLGAAQPGALVMIPNRKAIVELLRDLDFTSVVELVPPRFAPEPYLKRCRTTFFALKP